MKRLLKTLASLRGDKFGLSLVVSAAPAKDLAIVFEIAKNIQFGNVALDTAQFTKFKAYAKYFARLHSRKVALQTKRGLLKNNPDFVDLLVDIGKQVFRHESNPHEVGSSNKPRARRVEEDNDDELQPSRKRARVGD